MFVYIEYLIPAILSAIRKCIKNAGRLVIREETIKTNRGKTLMAIILFDV